VLIELQSMLVRAAVSSCMASNVHSDHFCCLAAAAALLLLLLLLLPPAGA
jgi:hypothetical protein